MDSQTTIYLIDDDPAIVRLVTKILSEHGYRVVSFLSGEAFLQHEPLSSVGCVITDVVLPGIQGAEIQTYLHRVGSPLTLMVISGRADVATAVQLMRSGAITLLQKPFSPEELLSAVEEGLSRNLRQLTQHRQSQEIQTLLASLTDDEAAVLRCLTKGMSRKAMTAALSLSPRTLDRRQKSLMEKMKVETVADLIAICLAKNFRSDALTP